MFPMLLPLLASVEEARIEPMRWTGRLRAFAACGLTGALLLLLLTPLCAAEVCPMDETARRMGCQPLASDCCQTHGERTTPTLHHAVPLVPLFSPSDSTLAMAAMSLLPAASWEELAPRAILQGIELHTLLSVFLI
jgi:hypothetical protein